MPSSADFPPSHFLPESLEEFGLYSQTPISAVDESCYCSLAAFRALTQLLSFLIGRMENG